MSRRARRARIHYPGERPVRTTAAGLLVRLDAIVGLLALLVALVAVALGYGAWLVSPVLAVVGALALALVVVFGVYAYLQGLRSYAEAAVNVASDERTGAR